MTLIKSISGIRGTIGGLAGDNLSPEDIVIFTAAYGKWLKDLSPGKKVIVVVGRDARISGKNVQALVQATLCMLGIDVIDLDLSTTPTVEMAVKFHNAGGGIVITASHNPGNWNALKLLNSFGEFISADNGATILQIAASKKIEYASIDELGSICADHTSLDKHVDAILQMPEVSADEIKKQNFKVVIDAVNSTGAIAVPLLLSKLGVQDITLIHGDCSGNFAHNPEPLPENLTDLSEKIIELKADIGIAVDPDVDRLVFVDETGSSFGEEYTLVAVADYVLSLRKGNTVSNLSSSRALRDVTEKHCGSYYPSAVGEVNVVAKMKECNAVIGGEGNGGVICPDLHYGRDALVGIALFLTHLAKKKCRVSELKKTYPVYFMSKNKIELEPGLDIQKLLNRIEAEFSGEYISTVDGLKIDFDEEWVHLRSSNTEPIIRIYAESSSLKRAEDLATRIIEMINTLLKSELASGTKN